MRSEEERAKRHISQARRQSEFIAGMQAEKERMRLEKARVQQQHQQKEESIRRKLMEERQTQI